MKSFIYFLLLVVCVTQAHAQVEQSCLVHQACNARYRYYQPSLGRWTQSDPARAGQNWYAYCGGEPVNRADPSGLDYIETNGADVNWVFTERGTNNFIDRVKIGSVGDVTWSENVRKRNPGFLGLGSSLSIEREEHTHKTIFWNDEGDSSSRMSDWVKAKTVYGEIDFLGTKNDPIATKFDQTQQWAQEVYLLEEIQKSGKDVSKIEAVQTYRDWKQVLFDQDEQRKDDIFMERFRGPLIGPGNNGPSSAEVVEAVTDAFQTFMAARAGGGMRATGGLSARRSPRFSGGSSNEGARFGFEARADRYRDFRSGQFVAGGDLPWPANRGFASSSIQTLQPGLVVDRYGPAAGRFAGTPGANASERGLPQGADSGAYSKYKVVKPIEAEVGPAAGVTAFGATGGSTQYRFSKSIQQLVTEGYLVIVP